jgi:hypothetical protein
MHVLPHCFSNNKKTKTKNQKKGRRQGKKERKEDVLAYPVDLYERGD